VYELPGILLSEYSIAAYFTFACGHRILENFCILTYALGYPLLILLQDTYGTCALETAVILVVVHCCMKSEKGIREGVLA